MNNWIEIKSGRKGRNGRKIKAKKREILETNLLLIPKDVFRTHLLSKLDLKDLKNLLLINPEYNTAITAYLGAQYYFKANSQSTNCKAKNIFIEEINDSNCKKILNSLDRTNVESIIIDENRSENLDLSKFENLKYLKTVCNPFGGQPYSKEVPSKIEKLKIWGNVNPLNLRNLKYFQCRFTNDLDDGFNFDFTHCPNIQEIYIYPEDDENSFYDKVSIEVKNCNILQKLCFAGYCSSDIDFEGCYNLWDIFLGEYFEGNLLNISDCKKLEKLKIGDIVKDTGPFGRFASVDHYIYFSSFNKPLNLEENSNLQELIISCKHTESVHLPKGVSFAIDNGTGENMYQRTYKRSV